jgi:hypothetical protein
VFGPRLRRGAPRPGGDAPVWRTPPRRRGLPVAAGMDLGELDALSGCVSDPTSEKSQRAMAAMLQMKKIDIAKLERAYAG